MTRVYLLEDDLDLVEEVVAYLTVQGYDVRTATSIRDFRDLCKMQPPDLVVLDRILSDGDSIQVIDELRLENPQCGVVMFTGKVSIDERIQGFEKGADHYLNKPVRLQELVAVMLALERRMELRPRWRLAWMSGELRAESGEIIHLTGQEAVFLRALLLSVGKLVLRRKVVALMGNNYLDYDPRNLDALLLRLRKKVSAVSTRPLPVKTVHGKGYVASGGMVLSDY